MRMLRFRTYIPVERSGTWPRLVVDTEDIA